MSEFNKHILLVMRWLQNSDLVSEEELKDNYDDAYDAYDATYDATDATASAADTARYAARYAAKSYKFKYWLHKTKQHLNKYFEMTKEDRGAYENRAKHLNVLGVSNG